MKITKNFSYWEFGPNGCDHRWVPKSEWQQMLIMDLALNLQKLRDAANKIRRANVSIHIISGIRTLADYYRLQGQGYHPSQTSDHFCGVAVPLTEGTTKFNKFGETYTFSVGAGDCVPSGISTKNFANLAMEQFRRDHVHFGQIIYEYNPVSKGSWVHLSNSYRNYFSSQIVTWLGKTPFLQSLDGGKSYQVMTAP